MSILSDSTVRQRQRRVSLVQLRPAAADGAPPAPKEVVIATGTTATDKPRLVFFYSPVSGSCRRVEGFLAQVLQRRRNHGTFTLYRVDERSRPDLVQRFGVETMPTLVVVEDKVVRARLERPRGCREIESFLAPWLK